MEATHRQEVVPEEGGVLLAKDKQRLGVVVRGKVAAPLASSLPAMANSQRLGIDAGDQLQLPVVLSARPNERGDMCIKGAQDLGRVRANGVDIAIPRQRETARNKVGL